MGRQRQRFGRNCVNIVPKIVFPNKPASRLKSPPITEQFRSRRCVGATYGRECKDDNTYRENSFRMTSSTAYFKLIKIGEESALYTITLDLPPSSPYRSTSEYTVTESLRGKYLNERNIRLFDRARTLNASPGSERSPLVKINWLARSFARSRIPAFLVMTPGPFNARPFLRIIASDDPTPTRASRGARK